MLSSVLNSQRAVQVNIQIMRIYTKIKMLVLDHKDILLKLEQLEKNVSNHNENFEVVFTYLKKLLNPKKEPMRKIGFRQT